MSSNRQNKNPLLNSPRRSRSPRREPPLTCGVCYEKLPFEDFPRRISAKCAHKNQVEKGYCQSCLTSHVEAEVNAKGDMLVKCPKPGCRKELEHGEIQALADDKTFAHYDKLLVRRAVASLPDFRWCSNARCGSGHEHVGGSDNPIMTCKACTKKTCYVHSVPWHSGKSCEIYDEELAKDPDVAANRAYQRRHTKPCPQCSKPIEKNGGCDHMQCMKSAGGCGYEFCWRCLSAYEPILRDGNHNHAPTCTYYAPPPPPGKGGRLADVLGLGGKGRGKGK